MLLGLQDIDLLMRAFDSGDMDALIVTPGLQDFKSMQEEQMDDECSRLVNLPGMPFNELLPPLDDEYAFNPMFDGPQQLY